MVYDPFNDVPEQLISGWCQNLGTNDSGQELEVGSDPEVISAVQAMSWTPNQKGQDMRPRVFDKISKQYILREGPCISRYPTSF